MKINALLLEQVRLSFGVGCLLVDLLGHVGIPLLLRVLKLLLRHAIALLALELSHLPRFGKDAFELSGAAALAAGFVELQLQSLLLLLSLLLHAHLLMNSASNGESCVVSS